MSTWDSPGTSDLPIVSIVPAPEALIMFLFIYLFVYTNKVHGPTYLPMYVCVYVPMCFIAGHPRAFQFVNNIGLKILLLCAVK